MADEKKSNTEQNAPNNEQEIVTLQATVEVEEECGGDLRVLVFDCKDTADEGSYKEESEHELLEGIRVTVTGGNNFSDSQVTDDSGELFWPDLDVGKYNIAVSSKPGYDAPKTYNVSIGGQEPNSQGSGDSITIEESKETRVEVCIVPQPGCIRVYAIHDINGSGDWEGQPLIEDVLVEGYQGEQRVFCERTNEDGYVQFEFSRPGLVTFKAPPTVRTNGCRLQLARGSILAMLEAGQSCDDCAVVLSYTMSLAEIILGACFIDQEGNQVPLDADVTFSVYEGSSTRGNPLRRVTARGSTQAVVSELEGDRSYLIVASPPKSYRGQELEPVEGREKLVSLRAGQVFDLSKWFCFRPCLSVVRGRVVDDSCDDGLAGVPVILTPKHGQGQPRRTITGPGGEFEFGDVHPDRYIASLEREKVTLADGVQWVAHTPEARVQELTVRGSSITSGPIFRLSQDVHKISGTILTTDDVPIPNAVVKILDEKFNLVDKVAADDEGNYEYIADSPGTFRLTLETENGIPQRTETVYVNQGVLRNIYLTPLAGYPRSSSSSPPPSSPSNGHLKQAIGELTSYPFLTEEVGQISAAPSPVVSGAPGTAPLGQVIERTLRDVLGWRPKVSDHKGFVAALTQSFPCEEVEDQIKCVYRPRTYAVQVQADLGAITGAQASIYARAKVVLDQSLILLDRLKPLASDADAEETDAARAIVRSELTELVNELGVEGGPRVSRIDTLFQLLRGTPGSYDPEKIGGQLLIFRDEFGLTRDQVNTIEEEQNLTDFITLVDYVNSLHQSWSSQKQFFDRSSNAEPFLGTQLVLVSRALAVVAESVQEVYFAMNSVFMGAAERQTTELDISGSPPIFVAELLAWVEHLASEEGPQLIQDGGKAGVAALLPTLKEVQKLVSNALITGNSLRNSATLPAGYHTIRVQRAMEELADHLAETVDLVQQLTN